jgi:hypothetical protein
MVSDILLVLPSFLFICFVFVFSIIIFCRLLQIGRLADIIWADEDVDDLRNNGILIDTEADAIHDSIKSRDDNIKQKR